MSSPVCIAAPAAGERVKCIRMLQKHQGAESLPSFQAFQSVFHPLLVVLHHVRVHVDVVAADVPLRAPVWDGPEAEWRVVLMRFLELREDTERGGWGGESGRRKNQQSETREFPSSSFVFDGPVLSTAGRIRDLFDLPFSVSS